MLLVRPGHASWLVQVVHVCKQRKAQELQAMQGNGDLVGQKLLSVYHEIVNLDSSVGLSAFTLLWQPAVGCLPGTYLN
jgi:hypothetical protein